MKKTKTLVVAIVAMMAFAFNANAQNENYYVAKAKVAAKACLENYQGGIYEITTEVLSSPCILSGEIHVVNIYAGPNCNGTGPCPAFPTVQVASVSFNCEGDLDAVTCY